MAEKEPLARITGRYVRAAGVAIQKERERRAAESEQRAAAEAEAAKAAQAAAPPPAAPPPPAAAPPAGRAARSPATGLEPKPMLDRVIWFGFLISLVAVCLVALQIQMVTSGSVRLGIRLALGGILIVTALALLTNWQESKQRLIAIFFRKFWGVEGHETSTGRVVTHIAKDWMLSLVGIVWLALGVFELLRGFVNP